MFRGGAFFPVTVYKLSRDVKTFPFPFNTINVSNRTLFTNCFIAYRLHQRAGDLFAMAGDLVFTFTFMSEYETHHRRKDMQCRGGRLSHSSYLASGNRELSRNCDTQESPSHHVYTADPIVQSRVQHSSRIRFFYVFRNPKNRDFLYFF